MKTKLLFIFCAVSAMSMFAQIPTPVIGLDFEDQIDDQVGTVTPVGENYDFETDADRGSTVVLFNGEGNGESIGNGTNTDGTYVDVTAEAYNYDALTINLWFYCTTVETWSRVFTFGTFGDAHNTKPEVWLSPANGRGVLDPDGGSTSGQLAFSAGMSDGALVEIGAGTIEAATWYMATMTHDADSIKLYLDGVKMTSAAVEWSPKDLYESEFGFGFAYLGVGPWPDEVLDGKIDNFTVYDKVLTDEEITSLFECTENCVVPVGINDISSDQLDVYSSNGRIYLKNIDNLDINSVQIYNMVGTEVYQTNEFNEVLSPNLPSSIYIVKIQSNKGDFTKKVNIQ